MPETKKTKPASTTQNAALRALSQTDVAFILGRPASFVRENAHIFERDADGRYDARQVVKAASTLIEPAEIPDDVLERVLQLADAFMIEVHRPTIGVRLLESIERTYGASGLAAVGAVVLATLREAAARRARYIGDEPEPVKTVEQIETEAAAWAARRMLEQAEREAREAGRVVLVCETCDAYRWGRKWVKGGGPKGYVRDLGTCPKCEAKQ